MLVGDHLRYTIGIAQAQRRFRRLTHACAIRVDYNASLARDTARTSRSCEVTAYKKKSKVSKGTEKKKKKNYRNIDTFPHYYTLAILQEQEQSKAITRSFFLKKKATAQSYFFFREHKKADSQKKNSSTLLGCF